MNKVNRKHRQVRELYARHVASPRNAVLRVGLLILAVWTMGLAVPAFAHPPDIVRISDHSASGTRVEVHGQVAYLDEPDGAYFVAWDFGDGSELVIITNGEQDSQGYTPWQSHDYPRRNGVRRYTLTLWGYEHHGDFEGRSDSLNVVVTCVFGLCVTRVQPETCMICSAPLEADLPSLPPSSTSDQQEAPSDGLESGATEIVDEPELEVEIAESIPAVEATPRSFPKPSGSSSTQMGARFPSSYMGRGN